MKKISVVILDDSLFIREAMQQELERDVNISVVGKAANAYDARDQIVEYVPDVLISDVNLGGMSGTEFVKTLLPQFYIPVIMMSSDPTQRENALASKAVDFVAKPTSNDMQQIVFFYRRVLAAVKLAVQEETTPFQVDRLSGMCLAVGASTGGAEAIATMMKDMPALMPPILVAQHMPGNFTKSFAERLNQSARLSIKEAEDGDVLVPGQVYIAPGGRNTVVKKIKNRYCLTVTPAAQSRKATPNIDMLFESVAEAYGNQAIGVLLTGMGRDGAQGLQKMHDAGAVTFAQDQQSCVVYGMPRVAAEMGAVDAQYPPAEIRVRCLELLKKMASA